MAVLKCLLQQQSMRETFTGGVGSHLLYHMIVQRADAIFGPAGSPQRADAGAHQLAFLAIYERVAVLGTRDSRSPCLADLGGKAWRWRSVRETLQKWRATLLGNGTLSELMRGWPVGEALLSSRQELRGFLMHSLDGESKWCIK